MTNQAVGVAAFPESMEFIQPGQSHVGFGEEFEDTVVLSTGGRLETLRNRLIKKWRSGRDGCAVAA